MGKGPQSNPSSLQRIFKNCYLFIRHYLPCILWGPQLRVRALCEVRADQRVPGVFVCCAWAGSSVLLPLIACSKYPQDLWLVSVNAGNLCWDSAVPNRGQHRKENRDKEVSLKAGGHCRHFCVTIALLILLLRHWHPRFRGRFRAGCL